MENINILNELKARALDFIKNISKKDKVALITHTDLDGIASAKVVEKVLVPSFIKFMDYSDFNKGFADEMSKQKFTKIIFTDFDIGDVNVLRELERFADILIIDHHFLREDFNSDKTVYINLRSFCATYISYTLFSEIKRMEELDWLVACACLADLCYFENRYWMRKVYEKYGEAFELNEEGIKKSAFWRAQAIISNTLVYFDDDLKKGYDLIPDFFEEVEGLKKYSDEVDKEIEKCSKDFDKERKVYGNIYYWEFDPKFKIKPLVINILSKKQPEKMFLFISPRDDKMTISARQQDGKLNLPDLLRTLTSGLENSGAGGHIRAAGGFFMKKDLKEFRKRVEKLG